MESGDRTATGTSRWVRAVVGAAATVLVAQLLQAFVVTTLLGGMPGAPGAADVVLSPVALIGMAVTAAVGVAFLRSSRRGAWLVLGGFVMTLTWFLALAFAWVLDGRSDSVGDVLQTGFGGVLWLMYLGAVTGPLWVQLVVLPGGLAVTRRWMDGPAPQLP